MTPFTLSVDAMMPVVLRVTLFIVCQPFSRRFITDLNTQVTANGGIISSLGTYQAAIVAKQWKKNFYVVAEQHKFGRTYPADQFDFTFDQAIIGFESSSTPPDRKPKEPLPYPVDYTVCARPSSVPTATCVTCHASE